MSSYPILCYGDMQRTVPADSGAGTRSYWVMPRNATIWNASIFRAVAKLIYFPISVVMFSILFHRLMWANFFYYILDIRFYFSLSVKSTSHFSTLSDFRQLQIPHAQTKYYEILPAHSKTPHDTTRKIVNRCFELKYHISTLKKKPDYFWTRVYMFILVHYPVSAIILDMDAANERRRYLVTALLEGWSHTQIPAPRRCGPPNSSY